MAFDDEWIMRDEEERMQRDRDEKTYRRSRAKKKSNVDSKILIMVIIFAILFFAFLAWDGSTREDKSGTYRYVGSKNSNIYHKPSCYWAQQINPSNEIWFTSESTARARGYRACNVCKP